MDSVFTLLLVLAGSALAVGLLVVLNLVVGGWSPVKLTTLERAGAFLERDVLGFRRGGEEVLCADGRAALFKEAGGGRLGLVQAMGDRVVVRALRPGEVRAVEVHGAHLTLLQSDFTFPKVDLHFASSEEARRWADHVAAFAPLDAAA